jgi:hypothetical protein
MKQITFRMSKSKVIGFVEHVACIEEIRTANKM